MIAAARHGIAHKDDNGCRPTRSTANDARAKLNPANPKTA